MSLTGKLGTRDSAPGSLQPGRAASTLFLEGVATGSASGSLSKTVPFAGEARAGASTAARFPGLQLLVATTLAGARTFATLLGSDDLAAAAHAGASGAGTLKKIKLVAGVANASASASGELTRAYQFMVGHARGGASAAAALRGTAHAVTFIELEIPAFYVDGVQIGTMTTPAIVNLTPDIHEGMGKGPAPAANTAIAFDLIDFGYDGIDPAHTSVTINGAPAITNGIAQTGFVVTYSAPSVDTLHVSIQPTALFASAEVVTVIVSTQTLGSALAATRTYQFEIADTIPPAIYGAIALAPKQVRVTWTEEVAASDPTSSADALDANAYALSYIQTDPAVPAVSANIVAVEPVTSPGTAPTVVDLITDLDLTPGVTYGVQAAGIEDLAGNASTDAVFTFTSFVPPRPATRDFSLWRMLPALNRLEDETGDLQKFIACFQEVTDLLLYDIDRWTEILDPDTAPEAFVDAMLADLGNPFPFVLDLTAKRKLAKTLIDIYKLKGTKPGILAAIRFFLGIDADLTTYTGTDMQLGVSRLGVDWVLGPGNAFALYAFRVVSPIVLTDVQRKQIATIANYMKVAHEHFVAIVEPEDEPPALDPLVLGVSRLGLDWTLH